MGYYYDDLKTNLDKSDKCNHWLFEKPRLMYFHFESIDRPLDFAHKVAEALKVLRKC